MRLHLSMLLILIMIATAAAGAQGDWRSGSHQPMAGAGRGSVCAGRSPSSGSQRRFVHRDRLWKGPDAWTVGPE